MWIWESIRMQSVPSCGQTELSWGESLLTTPVKKTVCTAHWDESGDSRGNMDLRRQERWAYTRRLNIELSRKIAGAVAEYAWENHADVIVFEYLEMNGKISGSKRQKLQLWRKRDIQKRCEHQAHRKGMRISRICAWNTSRLA